MAVYACINESGWVGAVTEQVVIPDGQVPASYVLVDLSFAEAEQTLLWHTYDAQTGTFGEVVVRPETARLVDHGRYFDLFTLAERTATFALLDGGDAIVRDLWARVQLGGSINLLSPRVAAGLAYLKSLDAFGADGPTADARIAAIIANEDPA